MPPPDRVSAHNGVTIAHDAVPGRLRLRAPRLKGSPDVARRAEKVLAAVRGVNEVTADCVTGSILLRFDQSAVASSTLADRAAESLRAEPGRRVGQQVSPPAALAQTTAASDGSGRAPASRPAASRVTESDGAARTTPGAVTLVSSIPGRIRFRVPCVRAHPERAAAVERAVRGTAGVFAASASAVTGSVLVLFDPSTITAERLKRIIDSARELAAASSCAPAVMPAPGTQTAALQRTPRKSGEQGALVRVRRNEDQPVAAETPWHAWSADAVAANFGADPHTGLTPRERQRNLGRYGRNQVPDIPRRPWTHILADQAVSIPSGMLSAAAVFSVLTGAVADAVFIGGALVVNAAVGFFTEDYAERTIESLRQVRMPHARVLRDGRRTKVNVEDVVPGDVLLLEPGHIVSADGRLMRSENLVMDESLLTGESEGQLKHVDAISGPDVPVADRTNMVFAGSAVASGKGAAIVTATGMQTELGKIRTLIGEAPDTPPPMSRELQRLGGTLALVSGAACIVFTGAALAMGMPVPQVLALAASLAVSAIPEGLPTVATTTLALGMRRMQRHNVVIRRLPAVAALGSSTVFCVDKTGTLTENRMSVRCYVLDGQETEVTGSLTGDGLRFYRAGAYVPPADDALLVTALQVGALCTEGELQKLPTGEWDAVGSATEQTLLLTAVSSGIDVPRLRAEMTLQELQERAPGRNYMASIHRSMDGGCFVYVKGAPEEVLGLCTSALTRGQPVGLNPRQREELQKRNLRLAGRGMRVLGLAVGSLQPGEVWRPGARGLQWVGLVGMEDPVRGEAPQAIAHLAEAGIRTLMITGDQPTTAESVARQVGLAAGRELRVADVSGIKQALRTGERLPDVLARVSPEHKYGIVRLLQERGNVVMMTGDGINDAPALKAAEVGIAMGVRSTQIARDIADVILLDDNLESVPVAVGHGRTIYANIRKALRFLIASNLSDVGLVAAALALRLPFPLTALQLLWMNLVTDIFPAIALSLEPEEAGVMREPPRPPKEPILTRQLWRLISREAGIISAATLGTYLWGLARYGAGARARSLAFTTITMAELAYALACRTEKAERPGERRRGNRYLAACLGVSATAQVATVSLPALRALLGTAPLSIVDWGMVGAISAGVLGATEAAKRLRPLERAALPPAPVKPLPSGI